MEIPKIEINVVDEEIARNARLLAWPIRVSLLRILIEYDEPISLDVFVSNSEYRWAVSRHLTELKKTGIINQIMINRKAYYVINRETFEKIGFPIAQFFSK